MTSNRICLRLKTEAKQFKHFALCPYKPCWPPGFCAGTVQQHYRVLCRSCPTKQVLQCVCMCCLHFSSRSTERPEASRNLCQFQSSGSRYCLNPGAPPSFKTWICSSRCCSVISYRHMTLSIRDVLWKVCASVLRPLPFEATCEGTQGSQKASEL